MVGNIGRCKNFEKHFQAIQKSGMFARLFKEKLNGFGYN